jgi:hypothetical protein
LDSDALSQEQEQRLRLFVTELLTSTAEAERFTQSG